MGSKQRRRHRRKVRRERLIRRGDLIAFTSDRGQALMGTVLSANREESRIRFGRSDVLMVYVDSRAQLFAVYAEAARKITPAPTHDPVKLERWLRE